MKVIRFLLAGCLSAIVNLSTLYILSEMAGLWYVYSVAIAFLVTLVISYRVQKTWTFQNHKRHPLYFPVYAAVQTFNLFLNMEGVYYLAEHGMWYMAAQVIMFLIIAVISISVFSVLFHQERH